MSQSNDVSRDHGVASARHEGRRHPTDDLRQMQARLDGLENRAETPEGDAVNNQQRDRNSKGVKGGYDDAVPTGRKEAPGERPLDRLDALKRQ